MLNNDIKQLPMYASWQVWIFECTNQLEQIIKDAFYKNTTLSQRDAIRKALSHK